MAEFHELHGDYVANTGQTISLREYLDYFEPLGSALSRLPDGTGGPFVHQFTDSGGRTIGSIGWVVSAASKRFGAWTLWGLWTERPIPAVALPWFWPSLSDAARMSELAARANASADRLFTPKRWPALLGEVKRHALRDPALRPALKTQLERAWSVPPPHRHSIEVELTPDTLDLLPWLYVLGPVDPAAAQLQPSRFNGAGYQYVFDERHAPAAKAAFDAGELIETTASDVVAGWRMAHDLRKERGRPPAKRTAPVEKKEMPANSEPPPPPKVPLPVILNWSYKLAVLALLAWIAVNVHLLRKSPQPVTASEPETSSAPLTTITPEETTPAPEPRAVRIANVLAARPIRNIRVSDTVLRDIAATNDAARLAHVAVEIFLRRNACFARTEIVDGTFSAAEERAIRTCASLQTEKLMKSGTTPDTVRAIEWLEVTVTGSR